MDRFLMIWPKSTDVIHINYHYTQFAEVIDYLDKRVDRKIEVIDEDIHNLNIIDFIRKNEVRKVVMQVNYENAMNAFKLADEIRLNFKNMPMLAYGSVPFLHPNLFLNSNFNAIYSNGDFEVAIETFLNNYSECDEADYKELKGISVIIENKLHKTNPGEFISNDEWGMSNKTRVPIMEYDNIKGKNRFVLNISRGCPFGCEHCLIQMVEGKQERRRSIDNIKQTLENITKDYKHIKIWAANFTLNKKYVEDFCNMMIESFRDIMCDKDRFSSRSRFIKINEKGWM